MIRLNGLDLHVEVEGSGQPLLLLHGFTGSARAWDALRVALRDTARVVAVDLIGHGQSAAPDDPSRYSLEHAASDLVALLDRLQVSRAHVLGYSMGGRLALHLAVHHPERVDRLILESASPGLDDPAARAARVRADDALARRIEREGVEAFVAFWEDLPLLRLAPHVSAAVRARQHALRLRHTTLGLANSLRGMGTGQQAPLWSALAGLQVPTLLITGALDARYGELAAQMQARLPRGVHRVIEAAGHTAHVDQPDAFAALVREALAPAG